MSDNTTARNVSLTQPRTPYVYFDLDGEALGVGYFFMVDANRVTVGATGDGVQLRMNTRWETLRNAVIRLAMQMETPLTEPEVSNGIRYFMDGNQICAVVDKDFKNLMESPVGFGTTRFAALLALIQVTGEVQDVS